MKAGDVLLGGPGGCCRSARASQAEKALLAGRNCATREARNPSQERSRGWGRVRAAATPPQLGGTSEGSGGRVEAVSVGGDVGVGEVFLEVP